MKQNSKNDLENIIANLTQNTTKEELQKSVCELRQYVNEQKRQDIESRNTAVAFIIALTVVLIGLIFSLNAWLSLRSQLKVIGCSSSPHAIIQKYDSLQKELIATQERFITFANSAKSAAPINIDFETWTCQPNSEWKLAKEVLTDRDGYMVQLITLEGNHTVTYPELIEQCDSLQDLVNNAIRKGYKPVPQKRQQKSK